MPDRIHLTVATVVKRDDKFLLVREFSDQKTVLNQPAGHVEPGETPLEAAVRETLEETGWHVRPTALISFTTYLSPTNGITYYRLAIAADAVEFDPKATLDSDIEEALWLDYEEILQNENSLRSPMVMQAINDYLKGPLYPLDILKTPR
ncbi:NUDIX hydrolase [Porticoccus litoralis]|uniref:Phosphatase NudJ n=1 Tax=Porticoccus litoralis TaxID=434086 RepID=A0AAW8B698_9GAMM|nr:NUDIX hydrolase [Porticoccus litoralis]MDP1521317.1 NUDIX hydrolase [Porticoccus litoralis]